jgi:hypothetical protein
VGAIANDPQESSIGAPYVPSESIIKGRTFWNSESIALILTASAQFGASFFQVAPVAELIRTPQIQFSVRHGAATESSRMKFSNRAEPEQAEPEQGQNNSRSNRPCRPGLRTPGAGP